MKKKKKKLFYDLADRFRGDGVVPPCNHFDKCGGCMFQDLSYDNQLLLKKEYINQLFEGMIHIDEVYPSDPLYYRNRMDMVRAFGKFGLREAGTFKYVVDVHSCEIMQKKTNTIYKKLRETIFDVEDYNYLIHEGYLRYVVLREAYFTGEVMINFVISERENRLDKIISSIENEVDSISTILSDGIADLSFGEVIEVIKRGYIDEDFEGIKFRITPNSFFQSNSPIALEMYKEIRKEVRGKTLDLYSGVGTISLFTAKEAEHITGVEIIQEAVNSAKENRKMNGIENVDFVCADAREYLREKGGDFDTLILDPPRSGMHPKMLKHINEMSPERIVYMSCNPATFKVDYLALENYNLDSFKVYDMFPQTPHTESLAVLTKK